MDNRLYEKPTVEIDVFSSKDFITTSGTTGGGSGSSGDGLIHIGDAVYTPEIY